MVEKYWETALVGIYTAVAALYGDQLETCNEACKQSTAGAQQQQNSQN